MAGSSRQSIIEARVGHRRVGGAIELKLPFEFYRKLLQWSDLNPAGTWLDGYGTEAVVYSEVVKTKYVHHRPHLWWRVTISQRNFEQCGRSRFRRGAYSEDETFLAVSGLDMVLGS